jgi:hypothetical protein
MKDGRYTVELTKPGGPEFGIEGTIASDDDLGRARRLYRRAVAVNPHRVIVLSDGERILARSDRPDSPPE